MVCTPSSTLRLRLVGGHLWRRIARDGRKRIRNQSAASLKRLRFLKAAFRSPRQAQGLPRAGRRLEVFQRFWPERSTQGRNAQPGQQSLRSASGNREDGAIQELQTGAQRRRAKARL